MYLQSLTTAVPPHTFTQRDCWHFVERSRAASTLKPRSLSLLQKVLLSENGIATRHFAISDLENIFDYRPDDLALAFEREAPALAANALRQALDEAELAPKAIDALFICTCTGYLCPGLSSHVAECLGLRSDSFLQDAVGIGCGAAIPTLRMVSHFLQANPAATAACVAVEICSAAFYLDDDPGVLISACLFSDGAAASIWTGQRQADELRAFAFDTLHWPEHREMLRFEARNGKLRNRLAKAVPATAAKAVKALFDRRGQQPVEAVIAHPGGRDVLISLASALPEYSLPESARVLRNYGNMSSPSVLFALKERLKQTLPRDDLWLVSFGAGFSCHSCRLGRGD